MYYELHQVPEVLDLSMIAVYLQNTYRIYKKLRLSLSTFVSLRELVLTVQLAHLIYI